MNITVILASLLSHYRRHPVQGFFLLAGIVIANVLLVGTLLINAQARASYDRGESLLRAGPVGQIRHVDSGRNFDEREYIRLRRQGFDSLAPVLRRVIRSADGEALDLLGIDLLAMPRAGGESTDGGVARVRAGSRFADFAYPPFELWASPSRLEQLGHTEGSRLPLASGRLLPPLRSAPGEQLGHRLLLDIGALQALTDSRGQLSSIFVFRAAPDRLDALRRALPDGLEFIDSEEAPDPAELTRSFHLNLAAMGLLAFVVGVFLIYNALAFSYTDRRELIRKLRLSGVTRRELAASLSLELTVFLALGSLLGFWLGAQMAVWLLPGVGRTLAQLYGVYIAYPDAFIPTGSGLPLLMTASAAALCVLFPLRDALHAPLLERWHGGWEVQASARRDRLLLGAGLLLLTAAAIVGLSARTLGPALAGMAGLLVGAVLCLPTVLRGLLAVLGDLVPAERPRLRWLIADSRWLLGPAAIALMALTLALVANSGLNTMIDSFRQATGAWLDQRLAAQLYLRGEVDTSELEAWLRTRDAGLQAVERYRTSLRRRTPGDVTTRVEVVSLQPGERFLGSVGLIRDVPSANRRFADGEGIYISERAWRLDGWRPGDRIRLCDTRQSVPVLGVYHDYGNPQSQWMASQALFRQCWPHLSAIGRAIYGPVDFDWEELKTGLVESFGLEAEQLIDQAELKASGLAVFDRTFTVTRALNGLTLLVAGIGIFCAVSAIHHHRVGQQALLASLGMTRRERGFLLLSQWGLLGLLCMALVWPFGTILAGYLASVVTPVAFGWSFSLRLEATHYLVLALLAALCLGLAVALPSLRLLHTSPGAMLREQAV